MLDHLPPQFQTEHNRQDLAYYLALQEAAFPTTLQYTSSRWDKRADFWESERKQQRKDDERVTATMAFLKERNILSPDCRIADIGCGPGRFAAAFAKEAREVVGFDISPKMAEYGNAYLKSQNLQNAHLRCCDFAKLDIQQESYAGYFDLVFSSMTPAIHNTEGLIRSMEMSRAWCLNISHIRRQNQLRNRILAEVFQRTPENRGEGRVFYALFNNLFLLGYSPETSYYHRRKEKQVRPDEEYVAYVLEHALPLEEHTAENEKKVLSWLQVHAEDGFLTEISDAVYGRILWDVRSRDARPDYRSLL